jgi:hydrogenase-4 component F
MFLNYFALSLLLGFITFLSRSRKLNYFLLFIFLVVQALMVYFVYKNIGGHYYDFFYIDSLGVIFFSLLALIVAFDFYHSYKHLQKNPAVDIKHESRFWAALMLFITSIAGVYFSDNLAVLWVFLEATTLFVAILLLYQKTTFSLEAAWKYLFISSVGLAIAFMGILILSGLTDGNLNISEIWQTAATLDSSWIKIVFFLIVTGLSVKMESFPFYPVCVDALGIAPPPVSALMTTTLMNAGLIGVFRIFSVVLQTDSAEWAKSVLLIMGILSVLIATYKMSHVRFLERLLAFSSLEHVGVILIAFSLGEAGFGIAIMYMILHSLIKASLFFQTDKISYIYHSHRLRKIGDYFRYDQFGAIVFMIGFFGIAAIPPSGLFVSEYLLIKAFIAEGSYFVGVILFTLLTIIIYFSGKNILHLLFTEERECPVKMLTKPSTMESVMPLVLLLIMMYLAFLQPDFIYNLIRMAGPIS